MHVNGFRTKIERTQERKLVPACPRIGWSQGEGSAVGWLGGVFCPKYCRFALI